MRILLLFYFIMTVLYYNNYLTISALLLVILKVKGILVKSFEDMILDPTSEFFGPHCDILLLEKDAECITYNGKFVVSSQEPTYIDK